MEERNSIVRDLLERSQLQEGEKERISAQLKGKEEELEKAQEEITKLNRRLFMDRVRARRSSIEFDFPKDEGMNHYTLSRVVDKIGREKVLSAPKAMVQQSFDRLSNDLQRGYIDDLEELGFFDNGLSMKGVEYLRALVKRDAA